MPPQPLIGGRLPDQGFGGLVGLLWLSDFLVGVVGVGCRLLLLLLVISRIVTLLPRQVNRRVLVYSVMYDSG